MAPNEVSYLQSVETLAEDMHAENSDCTVEEHAADIMAENFAEFRAGEVES